MKTFKHAYHTLGISIVLLLCIMLPSSKLFAQDLVLSTSIDSSRMEVGNHTMLRMEITTSKYQMVHWPVFQTGIHPEVEVLEYLPIDTILEGDNEKLQCNLSIIPFDTGFHAIAPLFVVVQTGTKYDTIISEPHLLEVYGPEVDTTQAPKAIKPIKEEPWTFEEMLPYILYGASGLVALLVLIWIIIKMVRREPLINPIKKASVPPHTEAFQALEKLKRKKLWESGEFKAFYTELTDITRHYMHRQMQIPALEETSDQIITHLGNEKLSPQLYEGMKSLFRTADFVKFAKMLPNDDENEIHYKMAWRFVDETYQSTLVEPETHEAS